MTFRMPVFLAFAAATLVAPSQVDARQTRAEVLELDEEIDLALSAAPSHLRGGVEVWALGDSGYRRVREGTNGFACIVNRDHPLNLKPTCYDAEGAVTILPKVVYFGELMQRGLSLGEIRDSIQAGFDAGRFVAPRRAGVAYMLSNRIRRYNPTTEQFGTFPPHIMFYAPNVTNEDIGFDGAAWRDNPSLPLVAYQGPHGFFVVVVPQDP